MHHLPLWLVNWDRSAFLAINHGLHCRPLDFVMLGLTDLGLGWVQFVAVLALAVAAGARAGEIRRASALADIRSAVLRRWSWVAPLLLAIVVSGLTSDAIKTIHRDRPWWFYEQEHEAGRHLDVQVYTVPGIYPLKVRGFPSGHTATSVATAMTATLLLAGARRRRRWIAPVWALALVVAGSRIYLGSHWPLDVLGGTLIGILTGWASVRLCAAARRRESEGSGGEPAKRVAAAVRAEAGPETG